MLFAYLLSYHYNRYNSYPSQISSFLLPVLTSNCHNSICFSPEGFFWPLSLILFACAVGWKGGGIHTGQEQPSTNDSQKVYKYPSSLALWVEQHWGMCFIEAPSISPVGISWVPHSGCWLDNPFIGCLPFLVSLSHSSVNVSFTSKLLALETLYQDLLLVEPQEGQRSSLCYRYPLTYLSLL